MSNNAQAKLLEEFQKLLQPLVDAAGDEDRAIALLASIGWDINQFQGNPLSKILESLDEVVIAYNALTNVAQRPPESFDEIVKAIGAINDVFEVIRNIPDAVKAAGSTMPSQFQKVAEDIIEFLLARYIWFQHPIFRDLARLLTVIQVPEESMPVTDSDGKIIRYHYIVPRLNFAQITKLLQDPVKTLEAEYFPNGLPDEAEAKKVSDKLFKRLEAFFNSVGLDALYGYGEDRTQEFGAYGNALAKQTLSIICRKEFTDSTLIEFGTSLLLSPQNRGDLGLVVAPFGAVNVAEVFGSWLIEFNVTAAVEGFAIGKQGFLLRASPGTTDVDVTVKLTKLAENGGHTWILGPTKGTHFEVGQFKIIGGASLDASLQDYGLLIEIGSASFVVSAGDGDGFLQKVLPKDGFRTDFDLAIGWSNHKGLYFRGSAGLEATLPVHKDLLGLLKIDSIYLALQARDSNIETVIAATASVKLGPITANIDRMGLIAKLTFPPNGGNLGPANLEIGFKPPDGAGLSIDASAIIGGGYLSFNVENEQYAGILYLEVSKKISLKAIGILTTRLPGLPPGEKGFSLLIIITAEFPPIQLGYGFALIGVGGLLGVNRTMVIDVLRDGIKNKTINSILFPKDPVANAPRIISDLQTIFPPAEGRFTIGPMAKIIWGGAYPILSIEMGILIELPSPVRLALLGKITLALPKREKPEDKVVVYISMDIIGTVDFDKGEASVDGVLTDSRIAMFPLTGGMALRLRWGSNPVFALAIGGFNPRFTPPPGFPSLDRLALQLSYQKDGLCVMLRLQSYLAVTANTLQFGARIDAYVEVSEAKIAGFIGFDALVELHPFHFIVDVYGAVTVQAFAINFNVDLFLTLSGPQPWLGDGHVTVNFIGKHEFPIHFIIGDAAETPALPPVDPFKLLKDALSDLHNWSAPLPTGANMLVTLRQLSVEEMKDKVLVHPLGELTVRQNVLPLGISLERFGAAVPTSVGPFNITQFILGTSKINSKPELAVRDAFARGQFVNLSEDEKLSSPGFESFPCGQTSIGTEEIKIGTKQTASFEYDVTIIDKKDEKKSRTSKKDNSIEPLTILADDFLRAAQFGAAKQTPMQLMGSAKFAGTSQGIKVRTPKYVVASTEDLKACGTATFNTYTEAEAARRSGAPGEWQVVEMHEVA